MVFDFGALGLSAANSTFGAIGSYVSGLQQFKYQQALQSQAAQLNYDYGQKSLKNSPSSVREGLEKAGYNPMLAVSNATSGANAGWTSTGAATGSDYSSQLGNFASNYRDALRVENETQQTESNVKSNEATARNQNAEAANREAENPFVPERVKAQIGQMNAQTSNLQHQNDLIDAQIDNMQKRIELDKYIAQLGYSSSIYSADKNYSAVLYNANSSASASRYAADTNAETQRGMRTDKLPFGIGSTYYDMRGKDKRMRVKDANDRKYWRNYY